MRNLKNIAALLNLIGLSTIGQEFMQTLTNITVATSWERRVNTILYTSNTNARALEPRDTIPSAIVLHTLANDLAIPLLSLGTAPPINPFIKKYNTELLTIAKLNQRFSTNLFLLKTLWRRLWRNRQSRLILLFEDSVSHEFIAGILQLCAKNHAMNVIALQPLMTVVERSYWTLSVFPTPKTVKCTFPKYYKQIFPKHLRNMHGHPLRMIVNSWHPQIYPFTPADGNETVSGFLGRALVEYATRHNATLVYPYSLNLRMFSNEEMVALFENKTIDIGTLTPIESNDRDLSFSVVFQRTDWCLMVPVEQPLSRSSFYYEIVHRTVRILFGCSLVLISCLWALICRWKSQQQVPLNDYLLNFAVLQGLLGQPFWTKKRISAVQKIISITISFAGVIVGTTYATYLQSFSVNAPTDFRVNKIEELLSRGIKVAVSREDLPFIEKNLDFQKYTQNFTIFNNFTEYVLLRDSLDTRYAFPVTDIWAVFDEQQKYFTRPLFRLSNICFGKRYPMVLPLQESSVYRERLNEFLAFLHEAGLIEHWRRHSFLELLEMNWIRLEDRNKHQGFKPLQLRDLHVVLAAMGALINLSIICLLFEIFWYKNYKNLSCE